MTSSFCAARRTLRTTLLGLALSLAGGIALAQAAWPTKPVRFIVSYPPGGLADIMARVLQQPVQQALGQPLVIDNRGGAAGNLAADAVAKSNDGHTFLVTTSSIESVNPFMFDRMTFDPAKDLMHVALLANGRLFLVTKPDLPVNSVKDLIAYARANPGKLSYASAGAGTTPHLAGEMLKQNARFFATHVPYRGAAPAVQDVLAGQVDFSFVPGTAMQYVRSGKLKMLAVASKNRAAEAPDVPTVAEQGAGDVYADTLFGFYAPAGTRPEVIERLNREINKALALPATKARFLEIGAEPAPMSPAQFKDIVKAEAVHFSAIVKARRITPD
jgi:tripartite-type tricarboxylate transporter receptor subunit TctC